LNTTSLTPDEPSNPVIQADISAAAKVKQRQQHDEIGRREFDAVEDVFFFEPQFNRQAKKRGPPTGKDLRFECRPDRDQNEKFTPA
jgi:hypothetical protein